MARVAAGNCQGRHRHPCWGSGLCMPRSPVAARDCLRHGPPDALPACCRHRTPWRLMGLAASIDAGGLQPGRHLERLAAIGAIAEPNDQRCRGAVSALVRPDLNHDVALPLDHQDGADRRRMAKGDPGHDLGMGHTAQQGIGSRIASIGSIASFGFGTGVVAWFMVDGSCWRELETLGNGPCPNSGGGVVWEPLKTLGFSVAKPLGNANFWRDAFCV